MRMPASLPRLVAGGAVALLLLTWLGTGSFLMALLVVALVGATAAGAWLFVSWSGRTSRGQAGGAAEIAAALPTADLGPAPAGERVRRTLRGMLGRPWVHGDGLIRAAARRLASEDALVWTPRGQRVTAPHLWVEFHPDDLADVAARWPLEVLADELLSGYLEHARSSEARRMAERTYLHLLAGTDVPVGRVLVTAAFSRPAATPAATTSATDPTPSSVSAPSAPAGPPSPPGPPGPAVPGAAGRPGPGLHLPPAFSSALSAAPPRPAPARGPAGGSRDSVGGFRGDGPGSRSDGATVTAPTAPTRGGTQVVARPTLVERVVATARSARSTHGSAGRPGVSWGRPADPRRRGGD